MNVLSYFLVQRLTESKNKIVNVEPDCFFFIAAILFTKDVRQHRLSTNKHRQEQLPEVISTNHIKSELCYFKYVFRTLFIASYILL